MALEADDIDSEHEDNLRAKIAALDPMTRSFLANPMNIECMETLADADLIAETYSLSYMSDLANVPPEAGDKENT